MGTDPKNPKRQSSHQRLFALLVSSHAKAVHRMLMKLTPGFVDGIKILRNKEQKIVLYSSANRKKYVGCSSK